MMPESQRCYLCSRNKAPSLSLFPACVKMESLIFVPAPPALAPHVKQAEFSSPGLGWNTYTDTTKTWFWPARRQPCCADTVQTLRREKPLGTSFCDICLQGQTPKGIFQMIHCTFEKSASHTGDLFALPKYFVRVRSYSGLYS